MAQDGSFVPAWKKLGLKLRNGDQSGDTAPDQQTDFQTAPQQHVNSSSERKSRTGLSGDSIQEGVSTENGRPAKLGKRKHQDAPAEEDRQAHKKSKIRTSVQDSVPAVVNAARHVTEQQTADSSFTSASSAAKVPQAKGDSNYRKKKSKKPKSNLASENGPIETDITGLLPSTEGETSALPSLSTPEPSQRLSSASDKDAFAANINSSPSRTDRRKSVSFPPDTKTVDGNSASNLFKKWFAEQKGADGEFSSAEASQFSQPPKSHPANDLPAGQPVNGTEKPKPKKQKKAKKGQSEEAPQTADESSKVQQVSSESTSATPRSNKKDFSLYTAYLSQYYDDRENWKFNKAKQNTLLDNALNIFRIPNEYMDALVDYVQGLKGASLVDRLKERCQNKLKELDDAEAKSKTSITDADAREYARLEALDDQISKEKRRRQTNADLEHLVGHPFPEGFVRRLERRRADALLNALNMSSPILPKELPQSTVTALPSKSDASVARNSRKRKSRTDISSDESSSESSSDESSSSEDPSSDDDDSESESGSDSDSDSDSGESKDSSGEDDSNSSSGSNDDSASASSSGEESEASSSDSD